MNLVWFVSQILGRLTLGESEIELGRFIGVVVKYEAQSWIHKFLEVVTIVENTVSRYCLKLKLISTRSALFDWVSSAGPIA